MLRTLPLIGAACAMLLSLPVLAEVHKCTDAAGKVRYSDRPCPAATNAQTVKIRNDLPSKPYVPVIVEKPEPVETVRVATGDVPNPRASYRCESAVGAVWYTHTGCPRTHRGPTGTMYRRGDGTSVLEVATADVSETRITRREACKAIDAVDRHNRFGANYDQKATTEDKAKGRNKC